MLCPRAAQGQPEAAIRKLQTEVLGCQKMPTVLQHSSTTASSGQVVSVQWAAPPHDRSMPMKRQMAGSSPHSDEARLVGNQPLSFDLDLQNGGASTSGKFQLQNFCLGMLQYLVSILLFFKMDT